MQSDVVDADKPAAGVDGSNGSVRAGWSCAGSRCLEGNKGENQGGEAAPRRNGARNMHILSQSVCIRYYQKRTKKMYVKVGMEQMTTRMTRTAMVGAVPVMSVVKLCVT
jgi:hypothetical protein